MSVTTEIETAMRCLVQMMRILYFKYYHVEMELDAREEYRYTNDRMIDLLLAWRSIGLTGFRNTDESLLENVHPSLMVSSDDLSTKSPSELLKLLLESEITLHKMTYYACKLASMENPASFTTFALRNLITTQIQTMRFRRKQIQVLERMWPQRTNFQIDHLHSNLECENGLIFPDNLIPLICAHDIESDDQDSSSSESLESMS